MAGEAYAKRYAGGFVDLPAQTTSIDSQFLNGVETVLSRLLGADPSDASAQIWDSALGRFKTAKLTAANISATAAISKSQLAPLGITDADVAPGANIAGNKISNIPASQITDYPIDGTKALWGDGTWHALTAASLPGYPGDALKVLWGDGTWRGLALVPPDATKALWGDGAWRVPTAGMLAGYPSDGSKYLAGDGTWKAPAGLVTSVFTRSGAVVAASGDYSAAQVTNAADKSSAATQIFSGAISTGPASNAVGGAGVAGNYIGLGSTAPYIISNAPAPTTGAYYTGVTGDTLGWRLIIDHAGTHTWGAGTGAGDTTLYRSAANVLTTNSNFTVGAGASNAVGDVAGVQLSAGGVINVSRAAGSTVFATTAPGDATNLRFFIDSSGRHGWGAPPATQDTFLYRSFAGVLRIQDTHRETIAVYNTAGANNITVDASGGGLIQVVMSTSPSNFTFNAPINPPGAGETQVLAIELVNSPGGTVSNINFATPPFRGFAGNPITTTLPASNKVMFYWVWNGTEWVSANWSGFYV